jgi:hypothetical protein
MQEIGQLTDGSGEMNPTGNLPAGDPVLKKLDKENDNEEE